MTQPSVLLRVEPRAGVSERRLRTVAAAVSGRVVRECGRVTGITESTPGFSVWLPSRRDAASVSQWIGREYPTFAVAEIRTDSEDVPQGVREDPAVKDLDPKAQRSTIGLFDPLQRPLTSYGGAA
jgi:hypothetical protein